MCAHMCVAHQILKYQREGFLCVDDVMKRYDVGMF